MIKNPAGLAQNGFVRSPQSDGMTADGPSREFADRLETAVGESLAGTVEWTLYETDDGYRLSLPDRQVLITSRDGPADSLCWTSALHSDGKIVSKFGPYEAIEALLEQVKIIVTTDVQYTVCCDG